MIGYHASHEQHPPSALLADARHAEAAGFTGVSSSDHFSPWSERQGESGFAWSWLAAPLQATGPPARVASAPGQRYHPGSTAHALATLCGGVPGRAPAAPRSGASGYATSIVTSGVIRSSSWRCGPRWRSRS